MNSGFELLTRILHTYYNQAFITVKLRYNGLAYNIFSVIAYTSSLSHHFSIQNMSVITYLDITYPWLLWTDLWAQTLQRTPASTYVRPPPHRLCSWLQSITVGATLMPSACCQVSRRVLIALLIVANVGQISLLRRLTRAGADQAAFQLCAIKETISSFNYTVWFERRYSWWHVRVCNF